MFAKMYPVKYFLRVSFKPCMELVHVAHSQRSIALCNVAFGGADSPFLMSLWRCPNTCRSSVRISAEHLAARARSITVRRVQ